MKKLQNETISQYLLDNLDFNYVETSVERINEVITSIDTKRFQLTIDKTVFNIYVEKEHNVIDNNSLLSSYVWVECDKKDKEVLINRAIENYISIKCGEKHCDNIAEDLTINELYRIIFHNYFDDGSVKLLHTVFDDNL